MCLCVWNWEKYREHFVLRAPMWNSLHLYLEERANLMSAWCWDGCISAYSHSGCSAEWWITLTFMGKRLNPLDAERQLNFLISRSCFIWYNFRSQERHFCLLVFRKNSSIQVKPALQARIIIRGWEKNHQEAKLKLESVTTKLSVSFFKEEKASTTTSESASSLSGSVFIYIWE